MVTVSGLDRPWVIPIAVVLLLGAFAVGYLTRKGPPIPGNVRWVANAAYMLDLPSFRSRLAQYRAGLAAVCVTILVGGVAAGFLLARPVDRTTQNNELATRDIVLCLDVSGSMMGYDVEIVDRFLELLGSFSGERIALSIWNQTSRTVFPLTDDYALVEEELTAAREALDFDVDAYAYGSYDPDDLDQVLNFIAGTELGDDEASSLIGDGLASCGLLFDEAESERSRAIILASDNDERGSGVYSLGEAASFVAERDITLVGIYSGESTELSEQQQKQFEDVVTTHNGLYFEASDPAAAGAIVERIQSQQAVDLDASPEVVVTDRPAGWLVVLTAAFVLALLALWRLRT